MSDDIVQRLRREHYKFAVVPIENKLEMSPQTVGRLASLWREAADEIERLRNELAARCGDHGPGAHTAGPVETFIPEAL